ncbi:glycoside hydrolase family 2, partial [bacterium]
MKIQFRIVALSAMMGLAISGHPSQAQWKPGPSSLKTQWAAQVSPKNVLPEYPRPQMVRSNWQSLNGLWSFGINHFGSMFAPNDMTGQILVPFPYESALSGIGQPSPVTQKLWYKRTFTIPKSWKNQGVLLHFGAVNYESSVMLNGRTLGSHKGGFDSFDFDITAQLRE